jgi:hypothetical protein
VVDDDGKLVRIVPNILYSILFYGFQSVLSNLELVSNLKPKVGIITRGDIVRAALQIKNATESSA